MSTINQIAVAVQAQIPVLVWGGPGVGKSAAITQLGQGLERVCEVVIASIREPSDFSGLPVLTGDGVKLEPPSWAKRLAAAKRGLAFFDEISCAAPATQAALLRVVLDRVVGDLKLHDGISIVAAANPPEQAAGGWELSPPLANRFCHLYWNLDARAWADGFTSGWSLDTPPSVPENWRDRIGHHRALVAAFIRSRQTLLHALPKDESKRGGPWPSPRTWDMAATLAAAAESARVDDTALVGGCVGEGAALEYVGWRKNLDLPDPEVVLANAKTHELPDRQDRLHAVLGSVVAAVLGKLNQKRYEQCWQLLIRASEERARDVAAVQARPLAAAGQKAKLLAVRGVDTFLKLIYASETENK